MIHSKDCILCDEMPQEVDCEEGEKRGGGETNRGEDEREEASLLLSDPCLTLSGLTYV